MERRKTGQFQRIRFDSGQHRRILAVMICLGMVPMDQVKTTVIYSQVPEVVNENTWWNDFVWGMSQLFANA